MLSLQLWINCISESAFKCLTFFSTDLTDADELFDISLKKVYKVWCLNSHTYWVWMSCCGCPRGWLYVDCRTCHMVLDFIFTLMRAEKKRFYNLILWQELSKLPLLPVTVYLPVAYWGFITVPQDLLRQIHAVNQCVYMTLKKTELLG